MPLRKRITGTPAYDPTNARIGLSDERRDLTINPQSAWYGAPKPTNRQLMVAPGALPEQPQAPVATRPNAWAENYRDIHDYSADITRSSAKSGIIPPMPDMTPVKLPGSNMFENPFSTDRVRQKPLTRREWSDMQAQIQLLHKPTARQEAQALEQSMMGQATGMGRRAPVPMRNLMFSKEQAARWDEGKKEIQNRFQNMLTRNTGSMDLDDLIDIGDNLSRAYPNHPRFIANMLQSFINRQQPLKREYDQKRMDYLREDRGSDLFRRMPEDKQNEIKKGIMLAEQGQISPSFAKDLGLIEIDGRPYMTNPNGGKPIEATSQAVAALARKLYQLEPTDKEIEAQTEADLIQQMKTAGQAGDTEAGKAAATLLKQVRATQEATQGQGQGRGVIVLPNGNVLTPSGEPSQFIQRLVKAGDKSQIVFRTGKTMTKDEAVDRILALRTRGQPNDLKLADEIEMTFGILP